MAFRKNSGLSAIQRQTLRLGRETLKKLFGWVGASFDKIVDKLFSDKIQKFIRPVLAVAATVASVLLPGIGTAAALAFKATIGKTLLGKAAIGAVGSLKAAAAKTALGKGVAALSHGVGRTATLGKSNLALSGSGSLAGGVKLSVHAGARTFSAGFSPASLVQQAAASGIAGDDQNAHAFSQWAGRIAGWAAGGYAGYTQGSAGLLGVGGPSDGWQGLARAGLASGAGYAAAEAGGEWSRAVGLASGQIGLGPGLSVGFEPPLARAYEQLPAVQRRRQHEARQEMRRQRAEVQKQPILPDSPPEDLSGSAQKRAGSVYEGDGSGPVDAFSQLQADRHQAAHAVQVDKTGTVVEVVDPFTGWVVSTTAPEQSPSQDASTIQLVNDVGRSRSPMAPAPTRSVPGVSGSSVRRRTVDDVAEPTGGWGSGNEDRTIEATIGRLDLVAPDVAEFWRSRAHGGPISDALVFHTRSDDDQTLHTFLRVDRGDTTVYGFRVGENESAFERLNALCLVNVAFTPPKGVACPESDPVTCGRSPLELEYQISLRCAIP